MKTQQLFASVVIFFAMLAALCLIFLQSEILVGLILLTGTIVLSNTASVELEKNI